jgi:hypothetical protein
MTLSQKEISVLKAARASANEAWQMGNKWEYGQTVATIVDLGLPVLLLFVSDEVFEKHIS